MRLRLQIFYLIAAITAGWGGAGIANAAAELSPAESDQVDRLFTEWDKPASPGCALGRHEGWPHHL